MKITLINNYCVIEPQDPLTKEDFAAIAEKVDPVIESNGKLEGLIIKTKEFPGWESFGDIVEHLRFVKDHHQGIKKVAFVTDALVADIFPAIVSHFIKAELKSFDFDEFEKAIEWVS